MIHAVTNTVFVRIYIIIAPASIAPPSLRNK